MREPIDFVRLAAELLDRIDQLVPQWLPGGHRTGPEYECADLAGGQGTSCKVNMHTGRWADFATDDAGGDLISLYAAIHGVNNGKAAAMLMDELGWQRQNTDHHRPQPQPAARRPDPPPADEKPGKRRTMWRPIVPVPATAPEPDLMHWQRGAPEASWAYRADGELLGYVARYRTSDGGKDIVPWTWCVDDGDSRGLSKWHMKQWEEPRPLFLPGGRKPVQGDGGAVVIVEGEKCAVALHEMLQAHKPRTYLVVSWPGGGKAWDKAAWSWLQPVLGDMPVILWPDCDSKHERLTAAERKEGVDEKSKPLLPAEKQPGISTMMGIAQHLKALGARELALCKIPEPGAVADGWDVADAIAQGWTAEQVEQFLLGALPVLGQADEASDEPPADAPHPAAGAGKKKRREGWKAHLVLTDKGAIKSCRENVVMALDGIPAAGVPGIPEAAGVIAYNEFTNNVVKLRPTPWGTRAGEWLEEDELEMGAWLVEAHWMPSMPRSALEEAVKMVAGRHRFHPVRAYLDTLRGTWDGTPRCSTWLKRVCNATAPADLEDVTDKYLARVGTWMLMAMCARVLTPGCKYDYMVIFEGKQGAGKSTLAKVLGGEWFADTGLVMGEKDAYQNLQGVWVYEIGELDSFSKAEVTKVKAFASSQKDRFRASFDRRPRDYPRQVIFVGTTNEDHYLTDLTGNRRFWPVRVTGVIDNEWLRANRDQLFAEALQALEAGHRFHPTADEQERLFRPQQEARTLETPIESRIVRYLYDEDQHVPHGAVNGAYVNEISTSDLLSRIGIGLEKQVTAPNLVKQANAILRKLGWKEGKSTAKGGAKRVNVFKRPPSPAAASTAHVQGHQPEEATDACPL